MYMKNPMTPEEMKQAIDDNDAGHPMQIRPIGSTTSWEDRPKVYAGDDFNFKSNEYRRKPELFTGFCNIYDNGNIAIHTKLASAKISSEGNKHFIKRIPIVEVPTWTESEPEEKNPWRPIVKGEWPECKPGDRITLQWPWGSTVELANSICWMSIDAIAWQYAEDE